MNERIDDLIALASLGELTEAEAAELDAAANSDTEVAVELAAALSAAAAIQGSAIQGSGIQSVTVQGAGELGPPATLRASVLAAIADVKQDAAPPEAKVVSIERARSRRFAPLAAAAAVLLILGGAFAFVRINDSRPTDSVAAVVEAEDAESRPLAGTLGDSLVVSYSPSEGALAITGTAVPAPAADETYQLWLIDDSGATSVGIFRPDDTGAVSARFGDVDPTGFVLGVTQEPPGGSLKPTLPVLASA